MLVLISFSISNKVFYLHTHLDSHGNLVTHSHPYSKSSDGLPLKSHHHSDATFAWLCMAEISVLHASPVTADIFTEPREAIQHYIPVLYSSVTPAWHAGRGPPVI
ncbi:MAG: hypothetical protein RB288_05675 [Bacteroidales bacterium]|nr:hypothetical protein [Bacteroidales bacterium]